MKIDRLIKISGKVQGVFYRASAKEIADKLNIKGWVKNAIDGSVLAYAHGEDENVIQFIILCKQGPPMAEVDDVIIEECLVEDVSGFEVRR